MRISDWSSDVCSSDLPISAIFNMRTGLVFYGGLIGASLGTIIYCRKNKIHLWRMSDVMAPRDRKRVVEGKSVPVRVALGGRPNMKNTKIVHNVRAKCGTHDYRYNITVM